MDKEKIIVNASNVQCLFNAAKKLLDHQHNALLDNRAMTNGRIGFFNDNVQSYCNEQDIPAPTFLFKCNPDCKHHAPD